MTDKKVHNLNADSLEINLATVLKVTENGLGVEVVYEPRCVPNKRNGESKPTKERAVTATEDEENLFIEYE